MNTKKNLLLALGLIFLAALAIRFLYFPNNVYFGFDQARDAFASQEIFQGHLKIIGPPTSSPVFRHGVLYYYIFGPIYHFSGGSPEAVSAFLRVLNAVGVILIFFIAWTIFNPAVGLISAILFAFSFEQTQFSLFLNHPSLVVPALLVFYLGLALWIFKNRSYGLLIALFGLGLSIQFEFVEWQLAGIFLLYLTYFRKHLPRPNITALIWAVLAFITPLATYLIAEVKNNFSSSRYLAESFTNHSSTSGRMVASGIFDFGFIAHRFLTDNLIFEPTLAIPTGIFLLFTLVIFLRKEKYRQELVFLSLWFFGGFLVYTATRDHAYFYNTGTSISLLVFVSFLLYRSLQSSRRLFLLFLICIIGSNLYLIAQNNQFGPNQYINPQKGLVLSDEKRVVDFIYQKAAGQEFAVNALTMPFNINTTWSYLFQWYGQKKYGYLPVWGGDAAEGYYGNLKVVRARSTLPPKRFLVIEPKDGIYPYIIDKFLQDEAIFTDTIEKRQIGTMEVWVQKPR